MDTFDGVTILATNLRANLDEAFTRRFDTIIDFPFPEEGERLCIWQTLLPAKVPKAPDLDLRRLARTFKLAGGSIRNIIVDAGYRAAADGKVLTMLHLLQSTRREVQKMGWLVNEKDFVL
jgi:SpoVK/Ycf46/Vps4 family AAA+-type ATPase